MRNNKMINYIVFIQTLLLCFILWRGNKHENKIKEIYQSNQFLLLTDNGNNFEGIDMWANMEKNGKIDTMFSWD